MGLPERVYNDPPGDAGAAAIPEDGLRPRVRALLTGAGFGGVGRLAVFDAAFVAEIVAVLREPLPNVRYLFYSSDWRDSQVWSVKWR